MASLLLPLPENAAARSSTPRSSVAGSAGGRPRSRKALLSALEREYASELARISSHWTVSRAAISGKTPRSGPGAEEDSVDDQPPVNFRMVDVAEALDMPGQLLGAILAAKCRDQGIMATKERQQRFAEFVLSNCSGTTFRMPDCNVGPECAKAICTGLAICDRYKQLSLSRNALGDEGCAAIAQAILETSTLEHVDLAANDITLTGANAIFVAMLGNSSVNSLDLSSKPSCVRNRIVLKAHAAPLEEMLIYNKSLKHLNVAGTSLGHEGLQVLARGLMGNTCLLTLDISQNSAGNKGASYIAEVLKVCALEELSLSENRIGDEGMICLGSALGALPNRLDGAETYPVWSRAIEPTKACAKYLDSVGVLRRIVLDTRVEDLFKRPEAEGQVPWSGKLAEAATALQMAVRASEVALPRLKVLNLSYNQGTAIGHRSLADALHVNSVLEKVFLDRCDHNDSDNGCYSLIVSLPGNTSLRHLSLQHALLQQAGLTNLAKVVAVNKVLRSLNLSGNLFDEAAAAAWAIVLRGNRELKQLHLNGCHLNDAAGIHLANSLLENEGLEVLSMRDNSIRDASASAFAEALHHNGTVTQLNLELNSIDFHHLLKIKQLLGRNEKIRQAKLPDRYRGRIEQLQTCKTEVERMTHVLVRNHSKKRKALWKQAAKVQTLKDKKEADKQRQASVEETLQELLINQDTLDQDISLLETKLNDLRQKGQFEVNVLSSKIEDTEEKISMGNAQLAKMRSQLEKFEKQASVELKTVREQLDKTMKAQQSASLLSTAARRNLSTFTESLNTIGQDIAGGVNPRQRWVEAPEAGKKASAKPRPSAPARSEVR